MIKVTWAEVFVGIQNVDRTGALVYGVPKGGMIATAFLRKAVATHNPEDADYILDDLIDSGVTKSYYEAKYPKAKFVAIIDKRELPDKEWVEMPWESDHPCKPPDSVQGNIIRILEYIGEDPLRPGLVDTPDRVVRSYGELYSGYETDVPSLFKMFDENHDEMVVLKGIRLISTCEHHMLAFTGTASVGYLPNNQGRVIGLSKIARVVNAFARRLQVQERLTQQIADAFMEYLEPKGVGVVIKAHHSCMSLRGVQDGVSEMVTSCLRGVFRDDTVKSEFLRLL